MAFQPGIRNINVLAANQPVANSVVPAVVTGFTFNMGAAKQIFYRLIGLFTLGATGGFRFLVDGPAVVTTYMASFHVRQNTTPTEFGNAQIVEAAFANAAAVADTYQLEVWGYILNGAAADVFSFKFAQNTADALPITMLAGTTLEITQF